MAVLHAYRVQKSDWWELAQAVREQYLDGHWMAKAIDRYGANLSDSKRVELAGKLLDQETFGERLAAELMLFDEGETWLVRPLEVGWFFHEQMVGLWGEQSGWAARVEHVQSEEGSTTMRWVENELKAFRYLTFKAVSEDDWWDLLLEQRRANGAPADVYDPSDSELEADAPELDALPSIHARL